MKTRRKQKPTRHFRRGKQRLVKVDLSDWVMGNWPDKISELINVEHDHGYVSISIDFAGRLFDAAVRQIITEALEVFFDEEFLVNARHDGIVFCAVNSKTETVIPWSKIFLASPTDPDAADAVKKWLADELEANDPNA